MPGNPVSSYVCTFLFVVPLIRALSGRKVIQRVRESALLGRDVGANDQREDYLRARLEERDDGTLIATPVNHQDSSLLANLAAAQALSDTRAVCAGGQGGLRLRDPALAEIAVGRASPTRNFLAFT